MMWVREYKMFWRMVGGLFSLASIVGQMKEIGKEKVKGLVRLREDFEVYEIVGKRY